jgi:hypothetical protein
MPQMLKAESRVALEDASTSLRPTRRGDRASIAALLDPPPTH